MHHWQNTGEQKMLFAKSSSKSQCIDIDTQKLREDLLKLGGVGGSMKTWGIPARLGNGLAVAGEF